MYNPATGRVQDKIVNVRVMMREIARQLDLLLLAVIRGHKVDIILVEPISPSHEGDVARDCSFTLALCGEWLIVHVMSRSEGNEATQTENSGKSDDRKHADDVSR